MFKRIPVAVLAALIFAASGPVSVLATASPALADKDDHPNRGHHVHRGPNPYGANGYWSNGAWHYRSNNGWHGANPKRYHAPVRNHKKHDHDYR